MGPWLRDSETTKQYKNENKISPSFVPHSKDKEHFRRSDLKLSVVLTSLVKSAPLSSLQFSFYTISRVI